MIAHCIYIAAVALFFYIVGRIDKKDSVMCMYIDEQNKRASAENELRKLKIELEQTEDALIQAMKEMGK